MTSSRSSHWDGVERPIKAWNQDQDLRSAFRNSTVWVYERFARQLGDKREINYMRKIAYGNAVTGSCKPFWVEGDLAISANERVYKLLLSMGAPGKSGSWFVSFSCRRPVPSWSKLKPKVLAALNQFLSKPRDLTRMQVSDRFELDFCRAGAEHKTVFVPGGYSDYDAHDSRPHA